MDINKLCIHCMNETDVNTKEACPHCGHIVGSEPELTHQLKPMTILRGKYLVGDVLGEGGFGITYIGLDLNLELKVAIKEFYPNGYATRESATTSVLTIYSGQHVDAVYKWRDNFMKEARSLAKCAYLPGVVGVRDFFEENNTAYLVMEYIEGVTLKDYAKTKGGRIPATELFPAIELIFTALGEVHKQGLIHRDISPDNIMLLPGGKMKLLDFGAAREYAADERSLSVMLKPGYAPEEQYRTKGKQGPWSDIYALAGTIYKCLTGITPPEAMERMRQDELQNPNSIDAGLTVGQEQALMKALAVHAEDRYQVMEEFRRDLYADSDALQPMPTSQTIQPIQQTAESVHTTHFTQTAQTIGTTQAGNQGHTDDSQKKQNISKMGLILVGLVMVVVVLIWSVMRSSGNQEVVVSQSAVTEEKPAENISVPRPDTEMEIGQQEESVTTETEDLSVRTTLSADHSAIEDTAIHRYELIIADLSWSDAYWDCIERGGYLVRVNSPEEFEVITKQIRMENKKNIIFWLGAARSTDSSQYFWIDSYGNIVGESINTPSYREYWLENEPSMEGIGEDGDAVEENCLSMIYRSSEDRFYWNDAPDDILASASIYEGKIGYICEYED